LKKEEKILTVAFWGHKDAPESIQVKLKKILIHLIEDEGANVFYVGNQGNFDRIAAALLRELQLQYPHIRFYIVLAYMPTPSQGAHEQRDETILPEVVAASPARFAISRRNDWMLEKSDTVVTYVTRSFGGAAKYKALAISKRKRTIEISE